MGTPGLLRYAAALLFLVYSGIYSAIVRSSLLLWTAFFAHCVKIGAGWNKRRGPEGRVGGSELGVQRKDAPSVTSLYRVTHHVVSNLLLTLM